MDTQEGWHQDQDTAGPSDAGCLSDVFEQKLQLLSAKLEVVGSKCNRLNSRAATAEDECKHHVNKYLEAESRAAQLRLQQESSREREQMLRHEVMRLEALLDAEQLQASFTERKLQQLLGHERVRSEHMRALRDDAILQRDDAVAELANAYADIDAMQATLADSAVYVRFLRKRVLELELEATRNSARSQLGQQQAGQEGQEGVFSMSSIKAAIQKAVQEASACDDEERRRRIKLLQLRWHPDKNPVLAELATEVTKLINQAIAE